MVKFFDFVTDWLWKKKKEFKHDSKYSNLGKRVGEHCEPRPRIPQVEKLGIKKGFHLRCIHFEMTKDGPVGNIWLVFANICLNFEERSGLEIEIWELLCIKSHEIANILITFLPIKMVISSRDYFILANIQSERQEMSTKNRILSGKCVLLRVGREGETVKKISKNW